MDIEFYKEIIPSAKNYKYGLDNLIIEDLKYDYEVYKYQNNEGFTFDNFNKSLIDICNKYHNIFCLIYLPWQQNTKRTNFFKLSKYLQKEFQIEIDFLIKNELIKNEEILYYGIVKIDKNNLSKLLTLTYLNHGIIFTGEKIDNKFNNLIDDFIKTIILNKDSNNIKAKLMNQITNNDKSSTIINTYVWDEFNNYHIDIFKYSNNLERRVFC